MRLNKFDIKSDGLVDLYRSAFYLAKGVRETGLDFLKKSSRKLGFSVKNLISKVDDRFLAEKVLDQYHRLRYE